MIAAVAVTLIGIWTGLSHTWRWVVLGVLGYTVASLPLVFVPMFRAYWNAPRAERANRDLAD
jgi:hypothetical protein